MKRDRGQIFSLKLLFFLFGGTNVLIGPFLPLYFVNQGFSALKIGFILGIATFFGVLGQPFWAYLCDRFNTIKKILLLLFVLSLFLSIGMFFSKMLAVVVFFSVIFYLVWSPSGVLIDTLAIKNVNRLHISYGKVRLWSSLGFAGIALIAGPLLEFIGISKLYILFWAFLLIITISILPISDNEQSSKAVGIKDILALFKNREFVWFLVLLLILSIPNGLNGMFSLHMKKLGGGEQLIGFATTISAASEVPIFYFLGRHLEKYKEIPLLGIVSILYTFRWIITAFITSPLVLMLFQVSQSVTFACLWLISLQAVVRMVPDHLRSTGQTVLAMTSFGVVSILGNIAGGWIFQTYGGRTMYFIMGLVTAVAAILFFITYLIQKKVVLIKW
ncbi:MFS transporter [Neobacillus novalis]|uniref:MFS transporter n=1 Tax=Neobacillus novalis TaxID=220687 RepID=A0AA95MLK2_9BACI|nr:MFS transporter [Neobacillus novalis]WHY85936.1 MFS transporter [Neobacillus novalis]